MSTSETAVRARIWSILDNKPLQFIETKVGEAGTENGKAWFTWGVATVGGRRSILGRDCTQPTS